MGATTFVELRTITPTDAAMLLQTQDARRFTDNNRNLRQHIVNVYASEMRAGKWKDGGQIVLCNGELIDGQHRLHAVIASQSTITVSVLHTTDASMYAVIDAGMGRTVGDVLQSAGVRHYNQVAAIARLVIAYETGVAFNNSHAVREVANRQSILAEATAHEQSYVEAAQFAGLQAAGLFNKSGLGAMFVVLSRRAPDAHEWLMGAVSGANLDDGDSRLAMIRWSGLNRGVSGPIHLAAWIRARNAHASNKTLALIKPWLKGQPFPRLIEDEKR